MSSTVSPSATTAPLPDDVAQLRTRVTGTVLARGEEVDGGRTPGQAVPAHSTLVLNDPQLAVLAVSERDVVETVRFAGEHGLTVRPYATGHGGATPVLDGVVVDTTGLAGVEIDPATRVARIGAGTRWRSVVEVAAGHGLAPITGSSGSVGVVGYLLGGGFGPLARSHGASSDRVRGFRVVLADGSVVEATAENEPDLFWALRGGKGGLGLVTRVDVELVPLRTLYGGSLTVDGPDAADVLRAWARWTTTAPDDVTTSVVVLSLPDLPFVPEPLRGRTVLNLRFAYPGDAAEGERLAAPLRAVAPALVDTIGEMPAAAIAAIHADPDEPGPSWVAGAGLRTLDDAFVDQYLGTYGPGSDSPFLGAEIRHVGAAAARDVPGGSAVGGRAGEYLLAFVGMNPPLVPAMVASFEDFTDWSEPWAASETNVNFLPAPWTEERLAHAWSPETLTRLRAVREQYDPAGRFPFGA